MNFSDDEVSIYISEISDKDDYKAFRKCPHIKYYARTLAETTEMFGCLLDEMADRNKLFNQFEDINNIYEYNKAFPDKALPYIYIISDEYHLYMEDDSDTDEEDYYKKQCQAYLKKIAKLSRNSGIYIVASLQRPDRESMPAIFKANLNVIVAFKQRNGASALTILDSYKPMQLKHREAIVDFGGDQFNIYSLYINNYMIKRYLDSVNGLEDNHKYVDLSPYIYLTEEAKNHKKDKKGGKKSKKKGKVVELETASDDLTLTLETTTKKRGKGVIE
jgi:S-DNA-T family DNA segregation ATPase FtsK/SpoIIIE